MCGVALSARALLESHGEASYADVTIDKYSPQHAELALTTGRPSVPYVFVGGKLVGGCDEDRVHPGVANALRAREGKSAIEGSRPVGAAVCPLQVRSGDVAMMGTGDGAGGSGERLATCRVCKSAYAPSANGPRACQYHPGSLRGESSRKGDWEGQTGPKLGDGGDLVYSWTCCGAPEGSSGCTFDFHFSYDE